MTGATPGTPVPFVPLQGIAVKAYVLVFNGKLGNEGAVPSDTAPVQAIAGKVKPWKQAVVFAVQETAAFTGAEEQSSGQTEYEGSRTRAKTGPLTQRATGRFVVPAESAAPGKYLKTIRLAMDMPPDPGTTDQVVLWLTESATGTRLRAGVQWSRDPLAETPFTPDQWEIEINLPDAGGRQ
jgi:hypothetical protein